jgi:hypothetical protein
MPGFIPSLFQALPAVDMQTHIYIHRQTCGMICAPKITWHANPFLKKELLSEPFRTYIVHHRSHNQ